MYLGIDLGTSSVKLLIMDSRGTILKTVIRSYPISYPEATWAEQNPDDWWRITKEGIVEILSGLDKSRLKGISFSGQMHGLVILDKNDKVIRPAILWCDQRTDRECDYLNNSIGQKILSQHTGNMALTGFTAPKLLWVKNNEPEAFSSIKKIMLPKDYLAFKLAGIFATDMSDASGTLLLDVKNRCWSDAMIDIIGIHANQLPKLFESCDVIGNIQPDLAEAFGINNDVKIIIGGGDQAVGAVGTGAVSEGIVSIAVGTSGVIFAPLDHYEADAANRLHSFAHANGKYHQMGVMLSAAASLKWWVEDVNNEADYAAVNTQAEKVAPGSDGLYFLPYLMGERTPHNDPAARGAFIGLTAQHTRGHLTRAIMEGVSYALNDSLIILKDMGICLKKVRISGGGAKSRLWKKIIADVFNTCVCSINATEGPAFGAAILAAVGCGAYKDVASACNAIVNDTDVVTPDSKSVARYKKGYDIFKSLYPTLKDTFRVLRSDG